MSADRASLERAVIEATRQAAEEHAAHSRQFFGGAACVCSTCTALSALDAFLAPKKAERVTAEERWHRARDWKGPPGSPVMCVGKAAFLCEIREAEEAAFREARACVPTNWCDELLTGPGANAKANDCREVERILRGVQDRIDALIASRRETQT